MRFLAWTNFALDFEWTSCGFYPITNMINGTTQSSIFYLYKLDIPLKLSSVIARCSSMLVLQPQVSHHNLHITLICEDFDLFSRSVVNKSNKNVSTC